MKDVEHDVRRALHERLGREGLRPAPLPRGSRGSIRRRRVALVLSSTAVVAGIVAAAAVVDRPRGVAQDGSRIAAPPPSPRPGTGTNHERVWDGDVGFELFRLDCGHGPIGDEDSDLDPDGSFCGAGLAVVNESSRAVLIPETGHVLTASGRRFPPWAEAMTELAGDEVSSPLRTSIPPGGAASLSLIFEYPSSLEPERLEVHASEGSPGAVILLGPRCNWTHYEGRVSGGCYAADRKHEVGVAYPHSISTYAGETASMLQVSCFDRREWGVVSTPATPVPEGFLGQGLIEMETRHRAIFRDNSGIVLTLEPTPQNEEDPGVCG